MDTIANANSVVNSLVWGPATCAIFVLIGILISVRTRFFQLTHFRLWWSSTITAIFKDKSVTRTKEKNAISQFQALSTALAATIGTGNVAGVATAIVLGGPGAIFWMWVSAFFGMMTKFAEIALSMKYRYKNDKGEWQGGPMVYLDRGLGRKWLAVLYAVFATLASFGIGCATQANSVADALYSSFGVNKLAVGIVAAVLCSFVIIGGIKRIGAVTQYLIPFVALFYIIGGIVLITMNFGALGQAVQSIFAGAFRLKSAGGGVLGFTIAEAMRRGVARGVFTNEAGLGSSSIAHAASDTKEPVKQAMWGVFEVFADTIVICTLTALVILTTGVNISSENTGTALTGEAFATGFGSFGGVFVSLSICLFAFATLVGWSYYGERTFEYLFGGKATILYRIAFVCCIVLGASAELNLVWDIADTLNGLMAVPNLIGLVALSGTVSKMTNDYVSSHKPRKGEHTRK